MTGFRSLSRSPGFPARFLRRLALAAGLSAVLGQAALAGVASTSPLRLSFTDFQPDLYVNDICFFDIGLARLSSTAADEDPCCAWAPVNLPQGASVTAMVVYLQKAVDADFTVELVRKDLGTLAAPEFMSAVSSVPFAVSSQVVVGIDGSIFDPVIDNGAYAYLLRTCLPEFDTGIYSVNLFFD